MLFSAASAAASGAENGALRRGAGRGRPADLLGSGAATGASLGCCPACLSLAKLGEPLRGCVRGRHVRLRRMRSHIHFYSSPMPSGKGNLGGDEAAGFDARETVAVESW